MVLSVEVLRVGITGGGKHGGYRIQLWIGGEQRIANNEPGGPTPIMVCGGTSCPLALLPTPYRIVAHECHWCEVHIWPLVGLGLIYK